MLTQTGYLGSVGPVFVTSNDGYSGVTIIQGEFENSKLVFKAKRPEYATNLRSFGNNAGSNYFEFQESDCTLGPYTDNQKIAFNLTSYKVTNYDGNSYEDYRRYANDWVTVTLSNSTPTTNPVPYPVPLPTPTPDVVGTPVIPDEENTFVRPTTSVSAGNDPFVIGACVLLLILIYRAQQF